MYEREEANVEVRFWLKNLKGLGSKSEYYPVVVRERRRGCLWIEVRLALKQSCFYCIVSQR